MQKAAFFRVEGALVRSGLFTFLSYIAGNSQGFKERVTRLSQMAFVSPLHGFYQRRNRMSIEHLYQTTFTGMSEDRMAVLSEEYVASVLKDHRLPRGLQLLREAREHGCKVVLVSDLVQKVVRPLADSFGDVDEIICNRLEVKNGELTGELVPPLVGGMTTEPWFSEFCQKHEIDIQRSVAYAAKFSDLLLLSNVGRPCAVNPDRWLRRAASESRWPVMEYRK